MASCEILPPSELLTRKYNDYILERKFTEVWDMDERQLWEFYGEECEFYGFAREHQSLDTQCNSLLPHDEERFTTGGAYGKVEALIADHGVAPQPMVISMSPSDVEMACKKVFEEMAYKNILGFKISDGQRVQVTCEKIFGSILSIKFEANITQAGVKARIQNLIMKVETEWHEKMAEVLETNYTTGFVVGEDQSHLFVLTCAHSFEACYDASNPISVATLQDLFKVSVWCDHDELNHDKSAPRSYRYVEVFGVDSRKDLLLLKVKKQEFCNQNHMVLKMTNNLHPRYLEKVGMVSWPPYRHRTTVMGKISNTHRDQQAMYEVPHRYDFSAIEVNIAAEGGSSGAPLVDKECEVVGMLHGGRTEGQSMNYFVSSREINNILGIINEAGPSS